MKIYWKISDVPGMAELSTKEQNAVWRLCIHRVYTVWYAWVIAVGAMAICIPLAQFFVSGFLGAAIGGGVGGLILGITWNAIAARFVEEAKTEYFDRKGS